MVDKIRIADDTISDPNFETLTAYLRAEGEVSEHREVTEYSIRHTPGEPPILQDYTTSREGVTSEDD